MASGSSARGSAPATSVWTAKAVVAVLLLGLGGTMCGGALAWWLPAGGFFAEDRARRALREDTAASLKEVVSLLEGERHGALALAHVLLWRDHLAGDEHRAAAEKILLRDPAARASPEGLYARALLVDAGGTDNGLDDDLKAAPLAAWTQLARATRSRDADERLRLLEQAATMATPLPHATWRWARAAAAAGDLPLAKAALERLGRLSPGHPGGLLTAWVVEVAEEGALPENRRRKPGEPLPTETRLRERRGLDPLDEAMRDLVVLALVAGRGAEAPEPERARVLEAARRSPGFTRAALDLALVDGDAAFARALVETQKSVERIDLLAAISRQRFLAAIPEAELRAAAREARRVDADGIALPFGRLRFVVDADGLPWTALPSAAFYPERRYARLLDAVATGGRRERLDQRLQALEQLALAERALAHADVDGAATFLTAAQTRAGLDPEVSLVEAALLSRRSDRRGAETAIDTAVASAAQDPELLVAAARLALEIEHLGGARRALSAFRKLGLKAAEASALEAIVEARSGDLGSARAAVAEATRLGGGDHPLTLQASVLLHRLNDPDAARAAALRLLKRGDGDRGGEVVAAWVADAARREGDVARAEATLQGITRSRPQLGEAWLFYAWSIDYNPQRRAEALAAATTATARLAGPLQAEAKRYALSLKGGKATPRGRRR